MQLKSNAMRYTIIPNRLTITTNWTLEFIISWEKKEFFHYYFLDKISIFSCLLLFRFSKTNSAIKKGHLIPFSDTVFFSRFTPPKKEKLKKEKWKFFTACYWNPILPSLVIPNKITRKCKMGLDGRKNWHSKSGYF